MSAGPVISGEEAVHTDKAFVSLQARAALVGAALERSSNDRDQVQYVVSVGPVLLRFDELSEAASWVRLREWCLQRARAAG